MRPRPLVLYHGECYDGLGAAWAFRYFYGEEADFVSVRYGDPPPFNLVKGRHLWLLDFSYGREDMKKLIVSSKKTTVYDHHQTAEAELDKILGEIRNEFRVQRDQDKIVFDMSRSGAGITYDEMERLADQKAGNKTPRLLGRRKAWIIDYIEDRDLWKFKLPGSKSVSAYLASMPMTFETFDAVNKREPNEVISEGMTIERYVDVFGEKAIKNTVRRKLGGYVVPIINVPYMNSSDHIGKLVEQNPDDPFAAGFFLRNDGKWQFGLRSRGEFDVSEIAKLYGGGGHKNAAGFQVETLPWEDQSQQIYGWIDKEKLEEIKKEAGEGFPMPTSIAVETEEGNVVTVAENEDGGLSFTTEAPEKEKKDEAD